MAVVAYRKLWLLTEDALSSGRSQTRADDPAAEKCFSTLQANRADVQVWVPHPVRKVTAVQMPQKSCAATRLMLSK